MTASPRAVTLVERPISGRLCHSGREVAVQAKPSILIALVVATGLATAILVDVGLAGVRGSSPGNLLVSPASASSLSLAIMLAGTIGLLGLQPDHVTQRRHVRGKVAPAPGWLWAGATPRQGTSPLPTRRPWRLDPK
jgi:hypothetical protein